jgi:hypothetical protein
MPVSTQGVELEKSKASACFFNQSIPDCLESSFYDSEIKPVILSAIAKLRTKAKKELVHCLTNAANFLSASLLEKMFLIGA